jgi:dephospho-CoA kinase
VGLVWITGNSGTGKSTVRVELARRGYQSFDADEDGISVWRDRTSGDEVYDPGDGNHPETWLRDHGWTISRSRVQQLALMAGDQLVFLCGSVENEAEVWDLFDVVVCLVLDEATLRERIAARTTNKFGKAPVELESILGWNPTMEASYREVGALVINANQSLTAVTDQVLAAIQSLPQHRTSCRGQTPSI